MMTFVVPGFTSVKPVKSCTTMLVTATNISATSATNPTIASQFLIMISETPTGNTAATTLIAPTATFAQKDATVFMTFHVPTAKAFTSTQAAAARFFVSAQTAAAKFGMVTVKKFVILVQAFPSIWPKGDAAIASNRATIWVLRAVKFSGRPSILPSWLPASMLYPATTPSTAPW